MKKVWGKGYSFEWRKYKEEKELRGEKPFSYSTFRKRRKEGKTFDEILYDKKRKPKQKWPTMISRWRKYKKKREEQGLPYYHYMSYTKLVNRGKTFEEIENVTPRSRGGSNRKIDENKRREEFKSLIEIGDVKERGRINRVRNVYSRFKAFIERHATEEEKRQWIEVRKTFSERVWEDRYKTFCSLGFFKLYCTFYSLSSFNFNVSNWSSLLDLENKMRKKINTTRKKLIEGKYKLGTQENLLAKFTIWEKEIRKLKTLNKSGENM